MKHVASFLLIALVACCFTTVASACDGCRGNANLYRHLDQKIPYFAAHPPVYYSYPVARPYGYSPFAYPPGTMTPHMAAQEIQPVTIMNPYASEPNDEKEVAPKKPESVASTRRPAPEIVWNPFIEGSRKNTAPIVQVSE